MLGSIDFDRPVRKEGRITGGTYGAVTRVYARWKPKEFKVTCNEHFVLEERNLDD